MALRVMEQMVMHSAKADTDEPIDVQPFKLDKQFLKADTKFSIDFIESGIRFNYGYSCNPIRITREWLIAYPKSRPQVYFERNHDPENQKDEYAFGAKLQGGRLRHDWARQTGRNTLYLSRAVQQSAEDLQQLKVPFNWFSKRLQIMDAGAMGFSVPGSVTLKKCAGEEKAKIIDFVSAADIPISDIKVEMKKWDSNSFPHDMPANIKAGLSEIMNGKDIPEIAFYHRDSDGDLVEFAESEESGGTRNLFSFAGPWTDVIDKERVLVIDELDTSLHPMVVHKLISMLHETTSRAQVVFTTHDTSIMSSRLLRRDQYYFVERDASGATHLKSLLEYKGREEDPIEKQYLAGVLGGTPILRGLKHVR
jgi:AAA15 family ATPase/GTPase